MCLITIAYHAYPDRPLAVAANRDEAYARPTSAANFWEDYPQVLAGRDLEAGGTWLGVDRSGRFAAITNFREMGGRKSDAPSRGHLVSNFLCGGMTAQDYVQIIAADAPRYNGFNLLLLDGSGLFYLSNRMASADSRPKKLPPGVYGLSNHLLDTPWPKVVQAKQSFASAIGAGEPLENLMGLLGDREMAADGLLPSTGVGTERERLLSPIFIAAESYGTRCSTLLEIDAARRARFIERSFGAGGIRSDGVEFRFDLQKSPAS
jgi:uncharacterized protein with NRDE domain